MTTIDVNPGITAAPIADERIMRPVFAGSAGEYFRIWIVNLLFSLATLGLFSPWAKVRKKKYFYGNTSLDGDTFDYVANPRTILKGRLLAVILFAAYVLTAELVPDSRLWFWAFALVVLPWLIVRALAFNARNSVYRGVRFDFGASAGQVAWTFIAKFLPVVATLGLAFPWYVARQRAFIAGQHAFGTTHFDCEISARAFFGIYFRSGLIVAVFALIAFVPMFVLSPVLIAGGRQNGFLILLLPTVVAYVGYIVAYAYQQARTTNLLWQGVSAAGLRFASSLSARRLAGLYLGNIVACVLSIGFLIPWASVRMLRYRLDHFEVVSDDSVPHRANRGLAAVGAAGQEVGDIFNFDLGW